MSGEQSTAHLTPLLRDVAGDLEEGAIAGGVVGVGIDAVDIGRFRQVLNRRVHLAERLFTDGERDYACASVDPVPRMCTRFAAKEATMKSLGVGLGAFSFADVEVVRVDLDPPALVLHGAARALACRAGVVRWHLSLTHTEQVAMAVVVAIAGTGLDPDTDSHPAPRRSARP